MKGALHVHTTYSDGELTLAELRRAYTALGYRFACLTDHAEYFDADMVGRYLAECDAQSDASFRFIPGLEYECPERLHILGLGCTALFTTREPAEVIRAIERNGGISVLAHPRTQDFRRLEALSAVPTGIEAWNSKYDGRYAPRTATFDLVRRFRARDTSVRAFFGQDLHFRKQYTGLHVDVSETLLDGGRLLAALREGRFVAYSGELCLAADGSLDAPTAARFDRRHLRSTRMRRLAKRAQTLLDGLGVGIPAGLKTQLRRIF
jgi:hypothetical protein